MGQAPIVKRILVPGRYEFYRYVFAEPARHVVNPNRRDGEEHH
jgi:hypothetical protein